MAKANKGAASIVGLMDSDQAVFVGLIDVNGDPVIDEDGTECGFMVTSNDTDKCKAVSREIDKAVAKLRPGKRLPAAKVQKFSLDMITAATTEIVGKFEGEDGIVTLENVRNVYKGSTVIRNNIGDIVGTPEVFTKGAMEQDSA